jgi:DNA polymerase (family 10)
MPSPREVSQALAEIATLLRFSGEERFKADAYEHAAHVVSSLGDELAERVEEDRLRDIQGIGAGLSRQIQELWNTGSSALLRRLQAQCPPGASELIQVSGMTPKRTRALHDALGISSVEQLREACAAGLVRAIAGFGPKTEQKLREGSERWLTRAAAPRERLLLARGLELLTAVQRELSEVVEEAHVVGAARRGEELLDELELVVVGDLERALARLASLRRVVRVDRAARRAHLVEGFTLELHGTSKASLGTALVQRTGNRAHWSALERLGATRGFDLAARPFGSEPALYGELGLSFVPPELRSGGGELESAARGGFGDLLELPDILGLVHCHTTFSDGRNSVLEMAQAAHALGMQYITVTDHSPTARYAAGVSVDDLRRQWDEIAAAQELVPIRILRGAESDILADGLLDYPDTIVEQFDVLIASIHARYRQDRATMTARLARALELPLFKIWGHALGRILNQRDPIDCDVPALLDVLSRSPGAIELNADPHRLDLPPSFIPDARARGIPFVVSVDAHSTNGFGVLSYGVTMARRGGLQKHEVLNTLPAEEFMAAVRPVPRR